MYIQPLQFSAAQLLRYEKYIVGEKTVNSLGRKGLFFASNPSIAAF